ncbi:hypothetical protein [Sorangium sp. So ce131]
MSSIAPRLVPKATLADLEALPPTWPPFDALEIDLAAWWEGIALEETPER